MRQPDGKSFPNAAAFIVLAVGLGIALNSHLLGLLGPQIRWFASSGGGGGGAPADDATLPQGYRGWTLISVAAVGPPTNDIRAKLGNEVAIEDFQQNRLPYRDGAIIVRLAWHQVQDQQTADALAMQARSLGLDENGIAKLLSGTAVAGEPLNVQVMVKDANKYASTGGWRWEQFTNGRPDPIMQTTCFACHAPAKATDLVFTHYAH